MRLALVAAAALALAACGKGDDPAVIDGSSEERFVASAAAARAELAFEDRRIFDEAMNSVGQRSFRTTDKELLRRRSFDGMTAQDVVDDARRRGIQ